MAGIDFHLIYAHSFRIRMGKRVVIFRPKKVGVGYYFIAPDKMSHVEYRGQTDDDLFDSVQKYLGVTAEKTSVGQFNIYCPASRLCPNLERHYQACTRGHASSTCGSFVATFRELTPKYDCQRSFDHTPTVDYTVPAVWACDEILKIEHPRDILEEYIDLLQKLKTKDARCFFASSDFRSVLDGFYAELFREESRRAEKDTRSLNCPSAADIENER